METFKRNGKGVRSPLWFAEENDRLYIWTPVKSSKIKRIRNNPKVRVVPSSVRGRPKGTWMDAEAHPTANGQAEHATELIRRKYGVLFWVVNHLIRSGRIIIEIKPTADF